MTSVAITPSQNVARQAARRQLFIASAALLGAGALLGVSTNVVKVAHSIGLAPLPFLTWSLAGATFLLTGISMVLLAEPALPALLPSVVLIAAGIVSMVISARACQPIIDK